MAPEFAVIDFETTGLRPGFDRVVEIGVVRTDESGLVLKEFASIVNPGRDIGAKHIHGLSASELQDAPEFHEIASELMAIVNGAILVAHNAQFDRRFLMMEIDRCDGTIAIADFLCTLELMYISHPQGPRKLIDCCSFLGISTDGHHEALADARMATQLLHCLLPLAPTREFPNAAAISLASRRQRPPVRRGQLMPRSRREGQFLANLINRLSDIENIGISSAVAVAEYLNAIDRALEDRIIAHDEAKELAKFASDCGLSRTAAQSLHTAYFCNLCALARSDGQITSAEQADLRMVADLLSIQDWESLLFSDSSLIANPRSTGLAPGMTVCLTGEMELGREDLIAMCEGLGLTVKSAVSRKVDILVLADTASASTKARKARELGVRMMAERVFIGLLQNLENLNST